MKYDMSKCDAFTYEAGVIPKVHKINTHTVRLGGIDHPQIEERRLISVTTGAIFIGSVALSPSVSEPLNATLRMKIAPVVAEIKRRSIFASVVNWKF
jgi:hypothetical protein